MKYFETLTILCCQLYWGITLCYVTRQNQNFNLLNSNRDKYTGFSTIKLQSVISTQVALERTSDAKRSLLQAISTSRKLSGGGEGFYNDKAMILNYTIQLETLMTSAHIHNLNACSDGKWNLIYSSC